MGNEIAIRSFTTAIELAREHIINAERYASDGRYSEAMASMQWAGSNLDEAKEHLREAEVAV